MGTLKITEKVVTGGERYLRRGRGEGLWSHGLKRRPKMYRAPVRKPRSDQGGFLRMGEPIEGARIRGSRTEAKPKTSELGERDG